MPQVDDQYENDDGQWCLVGARNLHLHTLPHRHKYRRRVPTPAASGAAGTATWFAAVGKYGIKNFCMAFNSCEECEKFADGEVRIVPLYAAPQPAKGWLTPTEREAIMYLIANRSQFAPQTPHEERRNAASRVCHDLLDRSSRPEVVRPKRWEDMRSVIGDQRDAEWLAALAAAGLPVKEVGRE
jgi:hypothetical protein